MSEKQKEPNFSPLFNMQIQRPNVFPSVVGSRPMQLTGTEMADFEERKNQELFSTELEKSMKLVPDMPFDFVDYKPQNPADGSPTFPKRPMMKLIQPEMMAFFDVTILFYIFYYFPSSPAQFFAARELNKRGWKFCINSRKWIHLISEIYESNEKSIFGKFEIFDPSQEGWKIVVRNSLAIDKSEFAKE